MTTLWFQCFHKTERWSCNCAFISNSAGSGVFRINYISLRQHALGSDHFGGQMVHRTLQPIPRENGTKNGQKAFSIGDCNTGNNDADITTLNAMCSNICLKVKKK